MQLKFLERKRYSTKVFGKHKENNFGILVDEQKLEAFEVFIFLDFGRRLLIMLSYCLILQRKYCNFVKIHILTAKKHTLIKVIEKYGGKWTQY